MGDGVFTIFVGMEMILTSTLAVLGLILILKGGTYYRLITRDKIDYEKEKYQFLEERFSFLNGFTFDKTAVSHDSVKSAVVDRLLENDCMNGIVKEFWIVAPTRVKTEGWKVFVDVKLDSGDEKEEIRVYIESDAKLGDSVEFKEYLKHVC